MSPFRSPIQTFLKAARTTLSSPANTRPPLTIVVGNQSADLDSILSALVLAYTLQSQSTTRYRTYIPVTNLEPTDLPLRPELLPALSHVSLELTDLITFPELHKSFSSKDRWLLVDHNKLELPFSNPPWKIGQEDIMGCIDHHKDEKCIQFQGVDMRIIQKSGSCMSLVINYAREIGDWKDTALLNQEITPPQEIELESLEFEAQTALIALAPILIDTANLNDASKTTEVDLEAVSFLEGKIAAWEKLRSSPKKEAYIRDAYFKELDTAKHDLEPFTLQQVLRKDYKEWEDEKGRRVGISAVVKPLDWMVEKAGRSETPYQSDSDARSEKLKRFWDVTRQFVESRVDGPAVSGNQKGLDVYSIMTAFTDKTSGKFKRELLVSPTSQTGSKALSAFNETCMEKFGLVAMSRWEIGGSQDERDWTGMSKVWEQKNLAASRKEVGPALRDVLQSLSR